MQHNCFKCWDLIDLGCSCDTFDLSAHRLELVHVSNVNGLYLPWSQGMYQTSKGNTFPWPDPPSCSMSTVTTGTFDPPTQREIRPVIPCKKGQCLSEAAEEPKAKPETLPRHNSLSWHISRVLYSGVARSWQLVGHKYRQAQINAP